MYALQAKTKFRRDLKKVQRRNWDLRLLAQATDLLIAEGKLPQHYSPHCLAGDFKGCMDAHIKPDWVLIYEIVEAEKVVVLHRTGSHQDVFTNY
jgi:mRNA interferase YafQ